MGQSAPAAASYLESAAAGALVAQTLAWFCAATWQVFTPPLTSHIANRSRRENSAEHSWHLAMFALILADDVGLDVGQVATMLLIHDIVEIDVGDTPIHGGHDRGAQSAAEAKAAERIFGILPSDQAKRLLNLWRDFEAAKTPEAKFAKALDRLQPLLLNILTDGGTWVENQVSEQQVHERYGPVVAEGSAELWEAARTLLQQHFAKD